VTTTSTARDRSAFPVEPQLAAESLLLRLNDPNTANALHSLLDNVELLAMALQMGDEWMRRGEVISSNIVATIAEAKTSLGGHDREISTLLPSAMGALSTLQQLQASPLLEPGTLGALGRLAPVLTRLAEPSTAVALNSLIDNIELVAMFVTMAEEWLRRGDAITTNIAATVSEARASLAAGGSAPDLAAILPALHSAMAMLKQLQGSPLLATDTMDALARFAQPATLEALGQMAQPATIEALTGLVALAKPELIATLGSLGTAVSQGLADARTAEPPKPGLRGLLKELKDPETAAGIAALLSVAKAIGRA
jgi:uncharacterized protein YjgD (DUF1641 family)